MKELVKIRKQWLLDPTTKIHQSKKIKQRFQMKQNYNSQKYVGSVDEDYLNAIQEIDDDKEEMKY